MAKPEKRISFDKLLKITSSGSSTIHFVGIGGVSMYSLARLALVMKNRITGSDREESARTKELELLGASISIGHKASNVNGASLVVYTHAVSPANPELLAAKNLGIPAVSRAEYMGALMISYKNRIGVSGSHGKSTTVAMLDSIFTAAGVLPTVLSGSDLPIGEPLKIGSRNSIIYEACEYKDSFLKFSPTIAIALNLELDHTDYFDGIENIKSSFVRALGRASVCAVINADDEHLLSVRKMLKNKVVTYGQGERADYRYRINAFNDVGYSFSLERFGTVIGRFNLNIPGVFNVGNAVAAIVAALEYGIDIKVIEEAISDYKGIARRLELVGSRLGRPVYYDYAHHPTEIRATVNAVKMLTHDMITVVFKPHTYSRTKSLWEDFRMSLSLADYVIMTDIYSAREEPIDGISSSRMAHEIGERAIFSADAEVTACIDAKTHGVIIIMGAGDLEEIKNDILYK